MIRQKINFKLRILKLIREHVDVVVIQSGSALSILHSTTPHFGLG